eukprot:TRINITY_DN78_c0_g1_i5.p1 TRINITY_DN78_c0_g1~~TRINITY_DN78_c0_g1_i5.p1  ORF type:complete len:1980 (-),score=659.50 TRINITY_DN78_c0_g1_i5:41-5980(-)
MNKSVFALIVLAVLISVTNAAVYQWSNVVTNGQKRLNRGAYANVQIGNTIHMFGGGMCTNFNTDTLTLTRDKDAEKQFDVIETAILPRDSKGKIKRVDRWKRAKPFQRTGGSAVAIDSDNILIHGGQRGHMRTRQSDLWKYTISTKNWTLMTPSPTTRSFHTAVYHNGDMFVYGGAVTNIDMVSYAKYTKKGKIYYRYRAKVTEYRSNELLKYNVATDTWSTVSSTGAVPPALFGPTGVAINGKLYMYGGLMPARVRTRAECGSDAETLIGQTALGKNVLSALKKITPTSILDKLRRRTRAKNIDAESNALFVLDLTSLVWSNGASIPTEVDNYGRQRHSAVYDSVTGSMLVYGGTRQGKRQRDVWSYDPATNTWQERVVSDRRYARGRIARRDAALAVNNDTLYVIAGYGFHRSRDPVVQIAPQVSTPIKNWVNIGGVRYTTLDDVAYDTRRKNCDTILRTVPSGWSLAQNTDTTKLVIVFGRWGGRCVAVANDANGDAFTFHSSIRYFKNRDCTGLEVVKTTSGGNSAFGLKRCARRARILIQQAGQPGDVDIANAQKDITNFIVFNGKRYATIDNDAVNSRRRRCQSLPAGLPANGNWSVAADDADTRTALMGLNYPFGTQCVVLANGNSYSTNTGEACGTNMLQSGGGLHYVTDCKRKVFLSAPAQPGDVDSWTTQPTVGKFITRGRVAYAVIDGAAPSKQRSRGCRENLPLKIPAGWSLAQDSATTRAALRKARFGGNCYVLANGQTSKRNGKSCGGKQATGQLLNQGAYYTPRYCHQRVLITAPATMSGSCRSWGDPHFTTFDGRRYNYYGIGDHTLFHAPAAGFKVDVRHFKIRRASANEGVAIKAGSTVIQLFGHNEPLPKLVVDGTERTISLDSKEKGTLNIATGVDIDQVGSGVPTMDALAKLKNRRKSPTMAFTFRFGAPHPTITVNARIRASGIANQRVMDIEVKVQGSLTFSSLDTVGLCGSLDGNIDNDMMSPSNVTFAKSQGQTFGETWKVTESASLFTQSPAVAVDPNFTPDTVPVFDSPQAEENARKQCAHLIEDDDLFLACLFDIAQTDDENVVVATNDVDAQEEEQDLGAPTPTYVTINDTIVYAGRVYAVLDGTAPDAVEPGCQEECIVIPAGWKIVEPSATNLVTLGPFKWGTNCLAFSDGVGYTPSDGSKCGENLLSFSAASNGTDQCVSVTTCNTRVYMVADEADDVGTLVNGNFDTQDSGNQLASSWAAHGDGYVLSSTVTRVPETGVTKYSVEIDAKSQNKEYGAVQRIDFNQQTAEAFAICGWSKSESLETNKGFAGSDYSIFIDVFYQEAGATLYGVSSAFSLGTHDWQYRCANVLPNSTIAYINVYGLVRNAKGKVWFDDFTIGPPSADSGNLLTGGNLDQKMDIWQDYERGFKWDNKYDQTERGKNGGSISMKVNKLDTKDATKNYYGAYQVVIVQPWMYKVVNVSESQVPALYVSGWSRSVDVSGTEDANYALYVDIVYTSGNHLYGQVATFPTGTNSWNFRDVMIPLNETIASFQVVCLFRNHTGEVFFDEVSAVLSTTSRSNLPALSHGDPHLISLDGLFYDMQAIGEFKLVDDGELEVQVRHSKATSAAVTSAVAMQYEDGIFELERATGYTEPTIRFNGEEIDMEGLTSLEFPDSTGTLTKLGSLVAGSSNVMSYRISYPTTEHSVEIQVRVSQFNVQFLRVVLDMPETSKGNCEGLLGNYNGDPSDDLTTSDGVTFPTYNITTTQMYGEDGFAESWNLDEEESLFTFPVGDSNADVTDLTWYVPKQLTDYTAEQRSVAESACGDVASSAVLFEACQFDVLATGDSSFSGGVSTIQGLAGTTVAPIVVPTAVLNVQDPIPKDEPVWWTVLRIAAFCILGVCLVIFVALGVRKTASHMALQEQKDQEREWAKQNAKAWEQDEFYTETSTDASSTDKKRSTAGIKKLDLGMTSAQPTINTTIAAPKKPTIPRKHGKKGTFNNSVVPV